MKKTITVIALFIITITCTSAYLFQYSTGIAGKTGSPGEQICGECHSGGSSAATGVTITSVPEFSLNQYEAGTIYTVSVKVGATGYNSFGFGCEILDSINNNAGTLSAGGSGVKFINAGSRRNAVHTTPKTGTDAATFSFKWLAPDKDKATIYVCGNAVNLNGNTNGDLPVPFSLPLTKLQKADTSNIDTSTVNIIRHNLENVKFKVYPNPSSELVTLGFNLLQSATIKAELIEISGKKIKILSSGKRLPGDHEEIVSLTDVPKGIYFIKLMVEDKKVHQKLLTVQ